jgi:hypothetical protein
MQRRVLVSKKQRAAEAEAARSNGNLVVHVGHQAETTPRQRRRAARCVHQPPNSFSNSLRCFSTSETRRAETDGLPPFFNDRLKATRFSSS